MSDTNEKNIETLNELIATCRDGELGFTACAEHVESGELRQLFNQRAAECRQSAAELSKHVLELGGEPEDDGTTSGAVHRGWVAVKGSLTGHSDQSMLNECERGEDAALARYRAAINENTLSDELKAIVARQQLQTKANHDHIKRLRDVAKASA